MVLLVPFQSEYTVNGKYGYLFIDVLQIIDTAHTILLSVIEDTIEVFFPHRLHVIVSNSKAGADCRRLTYFAYLCDNPGRPSPRAGRRAGPPRVPSRQAGTVAEEATNNSSASRETGREARRALGFPLFRRVSGLATYLYTWGMYHAPGKYQ